MPQLVVEAIAVALIEVGVEATAAYVAAYVIFAAAVITSAESQARSARNKARDASNRSQRDRYLMVRSNLEPRRLVLGRSRVSGPIAYIGSYGTDREHLVMALPIAAHEVDAIETIYFNDEPVELDGSGAVIGITRTDQFSISAATGTFTISSDPEAGTVSAKAYYGTTVVTLTVTLVSGRDVSVSGAHSAETGRLEISYRPTPNPFKPTNYLSAQQTATGTGSTQHVTLSHTPVDGSVHVVEIGTEGTEEELAETVTGTDVAFTATSGATVKVSYQWSPAGSSVVRIRKYLGRMDQAADAAFVSALPGVWTSSHRGAGLAYLAIEMDYNREAFSGGEPNISAVVRGAKCYDPRRNKVANPLADGAIDGSPGTLPTGWSATSGNGIDFVVDDHGTDPLTGWPYVTLHYTGTATADGAFYIVPAPFSTAPAAAAGQNWGGRTMVRRVAGDAWSTFDLCRAQMVSYASDGTATAVDFVDLTTAMVTGKQDPVELYTSSMPAGTAKAGIRVRVGYSSGQSVHLKVMVLLPQLWNGILGGTNDPYKWTENTALHAINYATHPIGGRLPWDQIDVAWAKSEANACDVSTTYTVGDQDYVRPLYRSSYVARTDQQPTDVLNDLCAAMGGEWAHVDGALRICAGAYRAPVLEIDESWLQGDQAVQIQAGLERDALVNAIRGDFIDARQAYRAVPFSPVEPATYIDADGMKLPREIEYGAIEFEGQAQYVASCALRAARQGITVRLKCNLRAWQVQTFDTVTVSLGRFGWVDKVFQVRRDGFTPDGGIELVLRETGASVFDMDAGFPAIDPEPNTRLPDPWWIPPVTGLGAASGATYLLAQADGTIVSRVWVTWDAVTDPRLLESTGFIDVSWRRVVDSVDEWKTLRVPGSAPGAFITPAPDRQHILIRAQAIGAVGKSQMSEEILHYVIGKSGAPSNVSNLDADAITGAIRLSWDPCPDLDYDHTELRRGGTNWATSFPLYGSGTQPTTAKGTIFDWAWPAQASYTIRAKHFDTSGNESATADTLALTVTDTILVGTDELEDKAATDVFIDTPGNSTWTVTNLTSVQTHTVVTRTYTNAQPHAVVLELSFSAKYDLKPSGGYSGTVKSRAAMSLTLNGLLTGPGQGPFDTAPLSASQTQAWTESHVWSIELDPGDVLDIEEIVQMIPASGSGSVSIDIYNPSLRTTVIKK
jgi:hypothetical protein